MTATLFAAAQQVARFLGCCRRDRSLLPDPRAKGTVAKVLRVGGDGDGEALEAYPAHSQYVSRQIKPSIA
jgi:hypothetical protein